MAAAPAIELPADL